MNVRIKSTIMFTFCRFVCYVTIIAIVAKLEVIFITHNEKEEKLEIHSIELVDIDYFIIVIQRGVKLSNRPTKKNVIIVELSSYQGKKIHKQFSADNVTLSISTHLNYIMSI
jgi:hypothetical protein